MSLQSKLCHDTVGQNRKNFYSDKEFLSHDRAGHDRKFHLPRQSWVCEGHARMTDQAKYARQIRLGVHDWSTKRVTEAPYRAQQRRPTAYDKDTLSPMTEPGAHDRNACATGMLERQRRGDSTLGAHTTRLGHAQDKDVRATEEFCRNRLVQ